MKKIIAGVLTSLLTFAALAAEINPPAIIPVPEKMDVSPGAFQLTADTRILSDVASRKTAVFLAGRLDASTGFPLNAQWKFFATAPVAGAILLTTKNADTNLAPEGYELTVTTNGVVIRAPTQAGLFYGAQTLLQLLPPQIFSSNVVSNVVWQMPCVQIVDQPRFKWRGFMLDVCRHFYTKEQVETVLDAMALYKLNTFHWHLTDDQGWRIEIKKYPKLTGVGAWRSSVGFGLESNSATAYDAQGRYGGFYTQDDIREVVAYAATRHITVVPEIEMPGHASAALVAYPQYASANETLAAVPFKAGVDNGVFNPANPATFSFLENILKEVLPLFPGQYVHIGGDEVPPGPWRHNAACQALMKREGLKNEDQLQSWFNLRIEKFLTANHKTLIGWSEITHGGLASSAVVMDWIGGGKEAASAGHDVVMTPTGFCYFDFYQSKNHDTEPHAIGGFLPLEKVYDFEPVPDSLPAQYAPFILGGQANLWTEYIAGFAHVEYMMFPRLCALAEVTWSPKTVRNYDDFLQRVKINEQRLDGLGVNYRKSTLGSGINHNKIGSWKASQIETAATAMNWEITTNLTAAGKVEVTFDYTRGDDGIDITQVVLLEDGKEISRDVHDGFAGNESRRPVFTLDAPAPKPGATYTIRALIRGDGGTDSRGDVYWNEKPAGK
jgi:hexosaminidase